MNATRARARPCACLATWAGSVVALGALWLGLLGAGDALGQAPAAPAASVFKGADLAQGERLIAEHRCSECHTRRVGGDGSAIYKPLGRVNSPAALVKMVDYCSNQLSLTLFPEEITAIAAVLQRDHYRFP